MKNSYALFIGGMILMLGILFIFLYPYALPTLTEGKRKAAVNEFITMAKTSRKLDPQALWKFEDQYEASSFTFSRERTDTARLKEALKPFSLQIPYDQINVVFLEREGKYMKSYNMLIPKESESAFIQSFVNFPKDTTTEFKSDNARIYRYNTETDIIIFAVYNQEEMKKAVGYFDYNDRDKKLVENKSWLHVAVFSHK